MTKEFHIQAWDFETRFTMAAMDNASPLEFSSIAAAAKHARHKSGDEAGVVVIHDKMGKIVNRIPLHFHS